MIIYISLIIYLLFFWVLTSKLFGKKNKFYLILSMPILALMVGFRNLAVGNDTWEYVRLFKDIQNYQFLDLLDNNRYESGYLLFNKIISLFFLNPIYLLLICSLITYSAYYFFIVKYSKNFGFSILLFVLMGYFGQTMNTIRLQLATVILIFGFNFLVKNKTIKFVCACILAFFFHKTAIIFLLALPLKKVKLTRKKILIICFVTLIIFLYFDPIFQVVGEYIEYYRSYENTVYLDGNIRIASILKLCLSLSISIFIYICYKTNKEGFDVSDKLMMKLVFFSVFILVISLKFPILDRVADYFNVYSIAVLPNAVNNLQKNRLIYIITILILFFAYFFIITFYKTDWNLIIPYRLWNY